MGALALVLFALPGSGEGAWECQTAHFRVISEPGPETAAVAAGHLEAVRQRLAGLGMPIEDEAKGPTLVLLFADRQSLDAYSPRDARNPALTRGLSLAGEDKNWIAVVWDAPGSPLTALTHEYAHLTSRHDSPPLWFREGLAEYLAEIGSAGGAQLPGRVLLHHLQGLRDQPWTGWGEFVVADRMSPAFARVNFYSQSWLVVRWLVAQGTTPDELEPADFESTLRSRGSNWVEAQLRAYAEQLGTEALTAVATVTAQEAASTESSAAQGSLQTRPTEPWELPYWKADFHRELQHWDQAKPVFERMEREYPEIPELSEALAAVAIAQGEYDQAEEKLRNALQKGSQRPSTHYQYSLMLMRPVEETGFSARESAGAEDRIRQAVSHARLAREAKPLEATYLLAEAQALVLAGSWNAAADRLLKLRAFPGWGERSEEEFAELVRRRQQVLRSVPAPREAAGLSNARVVVKDRLMVAWWWNPRAPEVPPPPPPPEPDPPPWPPPGTVLLYGYIIGVECLSESKIVTVKTPRYTIELREEAANPAKLYHPPKGWTALPCGIRGYEVNVAYRPLPPGADVRGELVAVVF